MRIQMTDSREISGHGLKQTGETWDAPTTLADQLIRQGVAVEALEEVSKSPIPKPKARVVKEEM